MFFWYNDFMEIISDDSQSFDAKSELVIKPIISAADSNKPAKNKAGSTSGGGVVSSLEGTPEERVLVLKAAYVPGKAKIVKPVVLPDSESLESEAIQEILPDQDTLNASSSEEDVVSREEQAPDVPALNHQQLAQEYEDEKRRRLAELDKEVDQFRMEKMAAIEAQAKAQFEEFKAEGFKTGKEAALKQFEETLSDFKTDLSQLFASRDEIIKKSEEGLVTLATHVAEKVINVELKEHKEMIYGILKDAIERVTEKDHVIFYINPEHEQEFKNFQEAFPEYFRDIKNIDLRLDRAIKIGGIEIETKLGFIDSRVSTKLDSIKKALDAFCNEQNNPDRV